MSDLDDLPRSARPLVGWVPCESCNGTGALVDEADGTLHPDALCPVCEGAGGEPVYAED